MSCRSSEKKSSASITSISKVLQSCILYCSAHVHVSFDFAYVCLRLPALVRQVFFLYHSKH